MASDDGTTANVDENILYDLTIHSEWPQEPEITNKVPKEKLQVSLAGRVKSTAYISTWTVLRTLGVQPTTTSPCSLPAELVRLVSGEMSWHFAVAKDGQNVAILQEQTLEIRAARDEYASVISKCSVGKDIYPQWRQVAWSLDGDMVAVSNSNGKVQVFDIMGTPICTLPNVFGAIPTIPVDLSNAVVSLIFRECKFEGDWSAELTVINYQGGLRSYAISRDGEYKLCHEFVFSEHYPRGVSAAVYHHGHSLLLLGGCADMDATNPEQTNVNAAMQQGITAWRVLSGVPYYKLVTDYEQDLLMGQNKGLFKRLRQLYPSWQTVFQEGIYKLRISTKGDQMAVVHYSGSYSVWDLPSLRLRNYWPLEQQPAYDAVNEEIAENPKKRKVMKEHLSAFNLVDSNWWSNEAVILARGNGAVTVSSAETLANLLGKSPEWFEPSPRVTPAIEGGFLGLECECKYSSLKRRHAEEENEPEYEDSEDEQEAMAMVTRARRYTRQVLYYVTDSETFQPPRKKPKLVTRTYRLICLKSTTPEELYTRKIDSEEYGEALLLAKTYGLDSDLVYQRQWRKTPVSVASIQDYLSKISKRSWVLHECLERVPENIDAMRELLQYGLRGTDLEALIAIGKGEDGGRFILSDTEDAYEQSLDSYDPDAEIDAKKRETDRRERLLKEVDFSSLTLEQRVLCMSRMKLLQYHCRLATYEEILGGLHHAEERFDPKFFENFRADNMVSIATDYARNGDEVALDILLTYHTDELAKDRLAILANFPETMSPDEYKFLLPVVKDGKVVPLDGHRCGELDWCELPECREAVETDPQDPGAFLYEQNAAYEKFRKAEVTKDLVSKWYSVRAREIEFLSRNVDFASLLVRIGIENRVKNLQKLKYDLETMETVVYQCYVDDNFTFEEFEKMADIEKLKFMMSKSNNEMYPKNIHRWLVPFLNSCESRERGSYNKLLREYMVGMAEDDLTRCRKVFEASKADAQNPVIKGHNEALSLSLDCVYACQKENQLGNAFGIVGCLPQRDYGVTAQENEELFDKIDELEAFLGAAEILESNGLPQTISYIRDSRNDQEKTAQLFRKLTRTAGRKTPPLGETAWRNLLCNLLDLREKVYRCVPSNTCYEIFTESLLCSGRHVNIKLASDFLESKLEHHEVPITHKVQFPQAVQLVLSAAREYFDSSGNLTDPCMELAKEVIGLIKQDQTEIAEELDLIESLTLLDGFAVQMLPVQVRMCEDRLDLIIKALEAKPVTYRNSQRLLKLAKLLRVCGSDSKEREGKVLQLVAQYALKSNDFKVAQESCKRMIEIGFSTSWMECKMLAEQEGFSDIHAKADLLCFAVTHCSAEMIEPILRAKCLLETKILYDRIHRQVEDRDSASPIENPMSAKGALHHTKEILTSTTKNTKAMLSTVTDKKWWKKTLRSLNRDRHYSTNSYEAQEVDNDDFENQGIHPFYESVIPDAFLNTGEADYCNMRLPRLHAGSLDLSEAVLRARKLEQTVTEGDSEGPPEQVLLQLAQDSLSKDTLLGLAYLLSLPKALDAEQFLSKNPHTAISLQIAAYYFALQIYTRIMPMSQTEKHPVYAADPTDVINTVAKKITELPESKWPNYVKKLVPQLKKYQDLLMDYTQAKVLQGLGRGVDVGRFTKDDDYKRETILGLAMTLEPSVFDIALSLAERYKLSLWEVYMTHLEYLFDSCERTSDIEQRARELALIGTLHKKPTEFRERMFKYVYPSLDGITHGRLIYFYTLLSNIPIEKENMSADDHVKLLKKIKNSAHGLDYKKLMSGEHRPLDVIRPALNTGNIHVISKLASKIPDSKGGFLDPSLVFCAWATNVFWNGETAKQTEPQTESEWLHRYDQCGDYVQKMWPSHFLDFVDGIVFTRDSIKKLGYGARGNVLKKALKFTRQQSGKKKRIDDAGCETKWPQAAEILQQWSTHLEKSNCATMQVFRDSGEEDLEKYAMKFDLSKNEREKVESLLMEVLVDGQLPDVVQQILDINPLNGWTPRTALIEAIQLCVATLGNPANKPEIFGKRDAIEILRALVQVTSEHKKHGGDLIGLEDVMSQVRPFCADSTKPVQDRLDALQIVERSFELGGEDLSLLTLYRTDAIVKTTWPQIQITQEQVKTADGRAQVFKNLLVDSETLDHYLSLAKLLRVWPVQETKDDPTKNPWYQLVSGLVRLSKEEAETHTVEFVADLQNSPQPLPQQVIQALFDFLKDQELPVCAIKCLLISNSVELHEQAISELKSHTEATEDEELLLLVLQRHLVASLVESAYYPKLVSFVIAQQEAHDEETYYFNPKEIANQLMEAGYIAHAGSLLAHTRGLNPALSTFNTAMNIVSSLFGR